MKKIFTFFVAVMAVVSVSAENYFLKSTWGEAEASWKQMIDDDGSFIFEGNVFFDGNDIAINTEASDEGARIIKVENIDATLNYEPAELAAGDSVFFVYVPDLYNQYNEKESGLMAMINFKKGVAIKDGDAWKNMAEDEGSFAFGNVAFDGNDVQVATGNEIRSIKPENIDVLLNYEAAELAKGDSVLFVYVPDLYNQYNEKESGLMAMINFKKGAAIKDGDAWKNMAEDEGSFAFGNVAFDGNNVQVATGNEIRSIKPENIDVLLNYEAAELAKGDSVLFVYVPELFNHYNEAESGLIAIINFKKGVAIKDGDAWKNMAEDEGSFAFGNVAFDGNDVQVATGNEIRSIKPENIDVLLNYEAAELAKGDSVLFVYVPELFNRYNEKESGLIAMVTFKNGYAIFAGNAWKDLTVDPEDEDWWVLEGVEFDGAAVQMVHENKISAIEPANIAAFIDNDFAELSAGDSVLFVFRPSMVNSYNPAESGLNAIITFKNGYALKSTWENGEVYWKNMDMQDEDTYVIENVVFDGKDVAIVNENAIRVIKVENIKAYLLPEYEETVLEEGDEIVFMYTPSEFNRYDETQPGLSALVVKKATQGVENVQGDQVQGTKVMKDGVLYLMYKGRMYDVRGNVVK